MTLAESFTIKSTESDLKLIFSELIGEYFTARIASEHLTASRQVCTYNDSHGLPNLLMQLAAYEKPWLGELSWEGLEGDFKFSATCSSLGHVIFRIQFIHYRGEDWKVETLLCTEMGQLNEIARSAQEFFGPSPY
jgi:hypothetical protein